jgi:diguanylate cyclase (GGDEF)-like protein/PAS domain S-box-containing protein
MPGNAEQDRYLPIFHDLATDLLRDASLDQILRDAVRSAIARLGFEECLIYLFDADREILVEATALGSKGFVDYQTHPPAEMAMGQGIVGHAARDRVAILVTDTAEDPRYVRDQFEGCSELCVPILLGDELIGVIDSEHHQTGYFNDQHREMLGLVAAMTAARIAHLRSTQEYNRAVDSLSRTEYNLRESRNFIREIIDTAPSVLYVLDHETKLMIEGMSKFAEFLGYEVTDIESMVHGVYSLLHPEDVVVVERDEEMMKSAPDGEVLAAEFRLKHKSGDWRWCLGESKVFKRDADGKPWLTLGSVHDITDMKAIQHELRDREHHTRSLFENGFDCIVLYDKEGTCLYTTPSIKRFTGYADHEVIGRSAMEFVHEDDVRDMLSIWFDLLKRPAGHAVMEQRIRHKDGHHLWIEARLSNRLDDPAVNGIVSNFHDIGERKRAEERIFRLANYDGLTQLPNRRMMMEFTEGQLASTKDDGSLTLLYVDLDRFKNVNDTLGHDIGDRLLKSAATAMQDSIGPRHALARLGGDEFAVVMSDVQMEEAEALAARQIRILQQPFEVDGYEIRISASIGIARYPDSAANCEELFKHADIAMYRAKQERNRFALFRPEDAQAMHDRVELERSLQRAIDDEEFHLVYQPRFELQTGTVVGVEALLRWNSERFGALSPGEFIPVAEETGQIYRIGEWMMDAACQQIAQWQAQGLNIRLAVNLSAHEIQRGDLAKHTRKLLSRYDIPEGALEIELTESAAMRDVEYSLQVLQDLSKLGVYLSIDDFGTGYSSLSYLKKLPVQCLKVDQSFLPEPAELVEHPRAPDSLMEGIVTLARQAGLATVAEGIEDPEQLAFARSIGCDEGQGYLLARPMSADEVVKLTRSLKAESGTG